MAKMTNAKLRQAINNGRIVVPITRPEGQRPVEYKPRNQFDPQPWTDEVYRYQANELELLYRDPVSYQRWLKAKAANVGETYADTRSNHAGGVA